MVDLLLGGWVCCLFGCFAGYLGLLLGFGVWLISCWWCFLLWLLVIGDVAFAGLTWL